MEEDQIWAQLELRAQNLTDVLEAALEGTGEVPESDEESYAGSMVRTTRGINMGMGGGDGMDIDADMDDMDFEDAEGSDNMSSQDDDDDSEETDDEEEEEENEEDEGEEEYGEDVAELHDPSDGEGDIELDASSLKGSRARGKGKGKGHSELDDGFFNLAAFNAETEEAEARASSGGKLGRDDSDDEDADFDEVDLFASVDDLEQEDDDQEPLYNDFFAPPSKVAINGKAPATSKAEGKAKKVGVRFHNEVRVKSIKAKGKNMSLSQMYEFGEDDPEDEEGMSEGEDDSEDEDEDEGDDYEEGIGYDYEGENQEYGEEDEDIEMASQSEDEDDATRETIARLKDDLFADEEDEEEDRGLSTYEKRMSAIREEIIALETENVAQKHWTLMGEATTRSRPQNALLEEDLEFERVMKSVPVITEETVQGLEERIKLRITANQFDDVVRKRPVDDKPFLPSRFFELQDTKSKQSLAEIYEDEYTAAKTGGVTGEDRDGKLKKEHDEIEKLWEQMCSKLDALCNAHFTPKAPKAIISTVANVSTATIESALPTTQAATTMLAPEEVFAPQQAQLKAKSELTPGEKNVLRKKHKKANKKARVTLEQTARVYSKVKGVGDVKKQKDTALKSLVKSGKGVTVIGKKSKESTSKTKT
ncbi:uncharacterized protein PHACADRAFT_168381 [Phanerochaete carnosa HHB-10118-sp]|uniref:U3 small nucleolar ribonucleoprotein protein MPP10 n=1 Tax=Phanerochaete carnosa (strain HHB-10118-sp) TaxID=650164 RepID=K5WP68_PHACS|nr:uncharacterized protein PHACADRAFT_168381 [Phanerochaete carnosa HHB-10118-sp]EKM61019.1 hypothetical protein PHACADRAFT_168381 [Phanerochaete carnosa HHB-10118-sp]